MLPYRLEAIIERQGKKMAEYHERRTVIETEPTRRVGEVETEHQHVSYERRGMSGAAVAAIVLSAVAAAVLLTLLFTSNQSDARDAELARDRIEPIQTVPAQQPAQQPPVGGRDRFRHPHPPIAARWAPPAPRGRGTKTPLPLRAGA